MQTFKIRHTPNFLKYRLLRNLIKHRLLLNRQSSADLLKALIPFEFYIAVVAVARNNRSECAMSSSVAEKKFEGAHVSDGARRLGATAGATGGETTFSSSSCQLLSAGAVTSRNTRKRAA